MLVEAVVVEQGNRRLENVRGRPRARCNAPAPILMAQRRLGLRSGEAELAGERAAQPRRCVGAKIAQSLSDLVLGEQVTPERVSTASMASGTTKRTAPAQSSPIWAASSENGEDN